jgi:hypothetical protein
MGVGEGANHIEIGGLRSLMQERRSIGRFRVWICACLEQ